MDPNPQRVASTDGVKVAVFELQAADPGKPTVLAAHATGFHAMVWNPLAERLHQRTGCGVVAPDLRGHGTTALPDDVALDWDGFADDVLATIDALGLVSPIGVGHSKGGAALLRAEARRPGTFSALWCFEPVVFPPEFGRARNEDNPLAAGALRRRDVFMSREDALANYASKPPLGHLDARVLEAYVDHGFTPVDPDDPDGPVRLRCRPEIEAETYRMGAAHNTFEFLGSVACPTVIACGGPHPPGPGTFADRIAGSIPLGRLATYPDLAHFGPLTHPELMADDIAAFISDVGA
jgi:pimeloyl-ACP methyl ester carboxylesterase